MATMLETSIESSERMHFEHSDNFALQAAVEVWGLHLSLGNVAVDIAAGRLLFPV